MTNIERRALLGDKEAQKQCTEKGIVLPCPFCGNKNIRTSNWGMWRCWCPECFGKSEDSLRERDAIKQWNTRHAPPIGRCGDCAYWYKEHCAHGPCATEPTNEDFFCGEFKPKGGEENG